MSLTSIGQRYLLGHGQVFLWNYVFEFIFQYNLSQVILSPTHNHGNIYILDLVIGSNDEVISDIVIHSKDMIYDPN